jgi:uncharacterized membrane protein
VFFTDAVVAIAITLIVLPLVDSARDLHGTSSAAFFRENAQALGAAGITFMVIGAFWRDHHQLFIRARGYTRVLLRLNMVWIAGIVFLPVATVLQVAAASTDRVATVVYLATIALTMAVSVVEEQLLVRSRLLHGTDHLDASDLASRWLPFVLLVVAGTIALVWTSTHLWALLLLFLQGPIRRLLARR